MGSRPTGGSEEAPDGGRRPGRVFLTTLRHDLRAPIGAIIGYAELLAEDSADDLPPAFLEDVAKIRSAGRSLLEMVDTLFDPAAIQAGRLDLGEVAPHLRHELRTPLNHVIGYAEMLEEEAEDRGLGGVAGDLQRIRESGIRILQMIDDVLTRATGDEPPATSRAGAEEGLSDVAAGVVEELEAFEAARLSEQTPEAGGRILVVDDNELNRDMLARRVRGQGHVVSTAPDGVSALEMLGREEFDVVLLDIVMPGMNGYEVLRRMKSEPALRGIPVIMISALDEVESAVRCIQMGAEDYLPKPFNPVLLRARLGASLEKKRLRDREEHHLHQIEEERRRADELLHVIFPDEIVRELKATRTVRPRRHEDVAVLFTDIVGFTSYSDSRDPEDVVFSLQRLVHEHEELMALHDMDKIKTIGDSFMAASGLLKPSENPVLSCIRCGLRMIEVARELPPHWNLRVGIHVGPVVGGVLGRRQYLFDLIGDTVNTASRVEQHGVPGAVTLSEQAWSRVSHMARAEPLGSVDVKGKGALELYRFVAFS